MDSKRFPQINTQTYTHENNTEHWNLSFPWTMDFKLLSDECWYFSSCFIFQIV